MSLNPNGTPSMEAPSNSAALPVPGLSAGLEARLFGSEHESDIVSHCPAFMKPVASVIIEKYAAPAEAVVGAMLSVTAAALGSRYRVATRTGEQFPASFNLVIAHQSLRNLGWFDLIQCPFIARVNEMQIALHRDGMNAVEREIEKRLADQRASIRTKLPDQRLIDQLKRDIARLQARLRPHVVTDKLSIRMIAELLTRAFDNSILAFTTSTDPLDDLSTLKPIERREVARILNISWGGKPIPLNRGSVPGTVSLLWTTPEGNLARLNSWREFHSGTMPVPILLLSSSEPMKLIRPMEEGTAWAAAVDHLFDVRCTAEEVRTYGFTSGADAYLAAWEEAYLAALDTVPTELAKHLVWLTALAYRVALLNRVTRDGNGNEIEEEDVRAAVAITKRLGAAHLRMLGRFVSPGKGGPTDATDRTDKSADMLAKIRKKGPISRRGLWRTYDAPRAEWYYPALEKLIDAGLVRYDETGALVACKNGGDGGGSGVEMSGKEENETRGDETH